VTKFGRFGLVIVTALAFAIEISSSALAWDWTPQSENSTAATTTTGFSQNQDVTINLNAVVVAVHATPTLPTVLAYNSAIPIVNVQPVVTSGLRPLVVGGPSCTVTIYGADAAGNLYNISSVAWMSPPQVVQWGSITSGPPRPGNLTPAQTTAFIQHNVLDLGYSTVANAPGEIVGMSFNEQAPANSPNTVSNIQVTSVVVLKNGSGGWSFNDLLSTVAAGTVVTPAPSYDVLLEIPGNLPYTTKILNVPAASITAVAP
jgi:hypothetical protein